MNGHTLRLVTSTSGSDSGPGLLWVDDPAETSLVLEQSQALNSLGPHTQAAEDLLAIAVAAYSADRSLLRGAEPDGWTRTIRLEVPVADPGRWDAGALGRALSFLTGDRWEMALYEGVPHPTIRTVDATPGEPVRRVALFSGGADSLAGAAEMVTDESAVALVSYFGDGPTSNLQEVLAQALGMTAKHTRFRIITTGAEYPRFVESTMRSRSFLFLALAILVASAEGVDRVQMAENGYIAVNVPLHQGRIGSLSTRTAHPHYVASMNGLLAKAEVGVQIDNPFLRMTKGEVCGRLWSLAPQLLYQSISCAHPVGRWAGEGFRNCGYCYPCIIRQAGIHACGVDKTPYAEDPFADSTFYDRHRQATSDVRSVARALVEQPRFGDVLATGPLSSYELAEELYGVYARGHRELRTLFEERCSIKVRRDLGI